MGVSQGVSRNNLTNGPDDPLYVNVVNPGGGGGGGSVEVTNVVAVRGNHVISAGNSTTTPLAAGATFTGAWTDVLDYLSIAVVVNTDHIAATGGLIFDFSTDGVNVDRSVPVDIVAGGDYCNFAAEAKFFRLRVVNGPQAQTFLRLQTQLNAFAESLKVVPLADTVTQSSSAVLTKSAIVGRSSAGGGAYVDVKVAPSGALQTEVTGTVTVTGVVNVAEPVTVEGVVNVGNFPAQTGLTDAQLRASAVQTQDASDLEYLRFAGTVTATGDTTLITPTAGKRIRLQWIYAINDPTASTSTKITIKLGSSVQYVAWAISKRQQLTGPVDGALIVNLSNLGDVAVTVFYQEVD